VPLGIARTAILRLNATVSQVNPADVRMENCWHSKVESAKMEASPLVGGATASNRAKEEIHGSCAQ